MCKEIFVPNIIKSIRPGIIHPSKFVAPENKSIYIASNRRKIKSTSFFKDAKIFGAVSSAVTFTFNVAPSPGDTLFINIRNGNATSLTVYTGWTLLGSVANSLYTLVRIADATDTGTYNFTWSATPNNLAGHAVLIAGTVGYQDYLMSTLTNTLTPSSASLSVLRNSTMLYYFSSSGNANGATAVAINTSGYTVALNSGFNIQTVYKTFSADTSEGFQITWSPGTGPAITRIVRIQILGAT